MLITLALHTMCDCSVICVKYLILLFFISNIVNSQDTDYFDYLETTTSSQLSDGEQKISEYILKVMEHYKQPNPEGLPGVGTQPIRVPDSRESLGLFNSIDFLDMDIYGVNKFRVLYINIDVGNMECRAALAIDILTIRGRYSINSFLNSNGGTFSANVTEIKMAALATLGVERDGKLRAHNILIDVNFSNIAVNFENSGLFVGLLQGLFNSMGTILFNSIKPKLLSEAYINIRQEINSKIDEVVGDIEFPNTISPMDMVVIDLRNKIRDMGMDPYKIDDYNTSVASMKFSLKNTWLFGLSTLHRVGNISINIQNKTVVADFSIGTQELQGSTSWELSAINGIVSNAGTTSFSVTYIRERLILAQPLDTRKRMELRDLDMDVGNVQLRLDGAGTLDYILEAATNILPNILRYQIVGALHIPLKWKIQRELDDIDIEEVIENQLPKIDEFQEEGLQLAMLRLVNRTEDTNCNDEFFNF